MDLNQYKGDEEEDEVDIEENVAKAIGLSPEMKQKKAEALGRVSAYSSLAVIASLLFGFAVTILFEFATRKILDSPLTQYPFCILMCIVLVCNAYSMVVMTFNYYVVYRFIAENKIDEALIFMRKAARYRKYARHAFRLGLFLFLVCTAIFLVERIDWPNAAICAVILITGTLVNFFTIRYLMDLQPHKITKEVEQINNAVKTMRGENAGGTLVNQTSQG